MSRGTLVGRVVGTYRLVDFLGAGGMGEVYRATHTSLGRVVAVKVLTGAGHMPGLQDRFRNEARIQATLHHPNVATLYDYLELDGRPCIIMEYVDGETLDALVEGARPLPAAAALEILVTVAGAVGYLHEHGIVHRDLKCANIKRTSAGVVKLLDFGLAKGPVTPKLTQTGHVVGTFDYMAPEQLTMDSIDGRTDLWALGVVLYELVTGRLPFSAGGTLEQMRQVVEGRYFPASSLVPSLPGEVDGVIARCLRPRPADRFASTAELARAAEAARTRITGEPPERPRALSGRWQWPELAIPALPRPSARTVRLVAAGAGAGLLVLLALTLGRPGGEVQFAVTPPAPGAPPRDCGLATTGAASDRLRSIQIAVVGAAADVYCGDLRVGRTPFTFRAELGQAIRLTLREPGWAEKPVAFTVSEGTRVISYVLERPRRGVGGSGSTALIPSVLALAAWLPWPFNRRRQSQRPTPTTRILAAPAEAGLRATNASLETIEDPASFAVEIRSDPGCVRESNEDSIAYYLPTDPGELSRQGVLLVVADGMGGHSAGEVASRLTVETLVREYAKERGDPQRSLVHAVQEANQAIQVKARSDERLTGMGTTCTALLLRQGRAYVAHVGDSRLYLIRGDDILQLTEDHSAVFSLVKQGVLDREEARVHPDRNVIIRALGSRARVEVAAWAQPLRVQFGDRFLVSTDGLHDLVPDHEILGVVLGQDPGAACEELIRLARERGGHDNISVGIVAVGVAPAGNGREGA